MSDERDPNQLLKTFFFCRKIVERVENLSDKSLEVLAEFAHSQIEPDEQMCQDLEKITGGYARDLFFLMKKLVENACCDYHVLIILISSFASQRVRNHAEKKEVIYQ